MPEVAVFAPGTISWVDLSTPDPEASSAFYGKLFGWDTRELGADAGGYGMFTLNGKEVAGVGPTQQPGQPPAWMVYVSTDDAEATARKVEQAGGKVVAPPFDVLKAGRMAVFQDPTGAYISVWQPGEMKGAGLIGETNAFEWAELNTRDVAKAKPFYASVFGWGAKDSPPMGESGQPYTEWQQGDRSVAGAMPMGPQMPAEVPPFWMAYFSVADVDAGVKKAGELGGKAMMGPQDFPGGRFAVIQDPQGAAFGLLKLKS